ncbi:tyrosine-type recombinase/integrase [Sinorhizobium chiapasense]|uniref:Tyrosine-type recombinase/integrase n=1 Tax=Sinorhizobium chiapasense TaxID=501572 RepID=A0ABZ2BBH5_9HYPH
MARPLHKLTPNGVKYETRPGRHSDGGGLYLQVAPTGSRSWIYMFKIGNKRTAVGLGGYPTLSLADARAKAEVCRKWLAHGLNPLTESRKEAAPPFRVAVERFLDAERLSTWKNSKHRDQWSMTLGESYCKSILDKPVDEIGTAEVLAVLKPVWSSKSETASRLRGRIERVLAFAEAQGWREGKNPAQWRGNLDAILPPRQKLTRGHHKALAYADVPAFMASLRDRIGVAARAMEFLVLTAARSGEVVGARWDEIDLKNRVWTVPASRMKAGREHRVPLSPRAVQILEAMAEVRRADHPYVFPGQKAKRPVSAASMEMLLRRLKAKTSTTCHGFRSSFRDWCGDATPFPREVAEAALAHAVGDATERAYRRSDALEKRRELMTLWADHIGGEDKGGKVIALAAKRG